MNQKISGFPKTYKRFELINKIKVIIREKIDLELEFERKNNKKILILLKKAIAALLDTRCCTQGTPACFKKLLNNDLFI